MSVWKIQLGRRIQECRQEKEISQKALGNAVGKDGDYISAVERGVFYPGVENLIAILKVLEVPADAVFFDILELSTDPRPNKLSKMMDDLSPDEREKVYEVLKLQIQQSKERDAAMKELKDKIDNPPKT